MGGLCGVGHLDWLVPVLDFVSRREATNNGIDARCIRPRSSFADADKRFDLRSHSADTRGKRIHRVMADYLAYLQPCLVHDFFTDRCARCCLAGAHLLEPCRAECSGHAQVRSVHAGPESSRGEFGSLVAAMDAADHVPQWCSWSLIDTRIECCCNLHGTGAKVFGYWCHGFFFCYRHYICWHDGSMPASCAASHESTTVAG